MRLWICYEVTNDGSGIIDIAKRYSIIEAERWVAGRCHYRTRYEGYECNRLETLIDRGAVLTKRNNGADVKNEVMAEMVDTYDRLIVVSDTGYEALWQLFGDVPIDPETEQIEEEFIGFPKGTPKEDIWHWFDERYSQGVHALLYGEETKE